MYKVSNQTNAQSLLICSVKGGGEKKKSDKICVAEDMNKNHFVTTKQHIATNNQTCWAQPHQSLDMTHRTYHHQPKHASNLTSSHTWKYMKWKLFPRPKWNIYLSVSICLGWCVIYYNVEWLCFTNWCSYGRYAHLSCRCNRCTRHTWPKAITTKQRWTRLV